MVFRTCILIYFYLQRLPLTHVLAGFLSLLKLSFHGCQSTVSMVFSCTLTEKVPSSLNERQRLAIISHDDSIFVYFIKMKDYIVKTMRSLWAAWNSRNTLQQFSGCAFKLIWLHENTGAMDELPRSINSKKQKISHWQGEKSYLWMEAVFENEFCNLQIYLSFFMWWSRI